MDLGDDQFVVFNGIGGFSLVVHGKPRWFGDLAEWRAVLAFALDADPESEDTALAAAQRAGCASSTSATRWCNNWWDDGGCHVARIEIGFHVGPRGDENQWLHRLDDHVDAKHACRDNFRYLTKNLVAATVDATWFIDAIIC